MTFFQDINDMRESDDDIVASFEQVLVPFVRIDTVAVMAIHSWNGFRRQLGEDPTYIESTPQSLNLQQFLSVSHSENITMNPHLPQAVPVKEMEKLLLSTSSCIGTMLPSFPRTRIQCDGTPLVLVLVLEWTRLTEAMFDHEMFLEGSIE